MSFTPAVLSTVAWVVLMLLLSTPGQATAVDTSEFPTSGCARVVGTWRWFNGAKVECLGNGQCEATNGFSGSWQCLDPAGRVEIRWSRDGRSVQYIDTLEIATDGNALTGNNQLGGRVSASRAVATTPPAVPSAQRAPVALGPNTGFETSRSAQVPLSEEQQETVELLGWPDAFTVLRIQERDQPRRLDAWTWHDSELTYVFVDGRFRSVEPATWLLPGSTPTQLRPDHFALGMTPAQARAAAASQNWDRLTFFEVVDGVSAYATDGAIITFEQDRLRGVETWSATARSPEVSLP